MNPKLTTKPTWAVDPVQTGADVKAFRESMGVSQLEVARQLGQKYAASVSFSESGKRGWTEEKLKRYIDAINRAAKKKISGKQPN